MNILVTGGAGYIGSHTAKAIAAAGHKPVVFDNLDKGHDWAVQWGPLIRADLADRAALRAALKDNAIDAVIHFAAFTAVGESMLAPEKYFRNNVANTLNLLGAMEETGVHRIVFSSTAAVYGNPLFTPIPEDHRTQPVNPYGESKLMMEKMIEWFGVVHGFRWACLRYFNAAGGDPDGQIGETHDPETHLIPLALSAVTGGIPHLRMFGTDYPTPDGTAIRDYIHVTDLGSAHVLATEYLVAGGSSLIANLGTGEGNSVREVVRTVEKVTGRAVPVVESPRREGDPPVLVADSAKAKKTLGWTPRHSSLEEIVRTAWAWHQAHS